ncbi:hypothetical protein KUTeg_010801 [Tegillarca granosa]|uniref:TM2 domain-containing protein n=1 Tax=Tegillarca granosa TaxID=220873 RepID=A0ABQ9F4C8_TEGGR|nr:hypothetical protein KUTeg_010801 [Tegillarca granosa]
MFSFEDKRFHHFYLRNYKRGVLYFFTFGVFGVGWLLDMCLMPSYVKRSNEQKKDEMKRVSDAYFFGITPLGLIGAHHFYLNRPLWGIFYIHTLAGFGIGWIIDWFRMPVLVKRNNKLHTEGDFGRRYLDDAYILWFPCGLLGFHHFYLNRPGWGILYFFTFGILGIGWMIDFFRLPCLVKEYNRSLSGKVVSPARQGVILSNPSFTDGGQNVYGQCAQNGYGMTGTTYVMPPNSSGVPSIKSRIPDSYDKPSPSSPLPRRIHKQWI